MKNMIVDLNNISFITRHKVIKGSQRGNSFVKEFIFREVLNKIIKTAKELNADSIVIATDSKNVWRKDIYPQYKENRTGDIDDPFHKDTIEAINLVKEFFQTNTSAYVLSVPRTEADDIISYWCKFSEGTENVILSADKDFIQLIDENTTLFNPLKNDYRTSEDAGFELFLKCIRGDAGDAIRSAYPRIRETKLREAWEDDYKLLNLLETVRKDGVKVDDAFTMNKQLIDLSMQPDTIKDAIRETIDNYEPAKYNQLAAIKFMADLGLKNTSQIFEYKDRPLAQAPVLINK
jgi:hypothetical protein